MADFLGKASVFRTSPRVLASVAVTAATKAELRQKKAGLNPFALKLAVTKSMKDIETLRRLHP
jgi:hypothetical protein